MTGAASWSTDSPEVVVHVAVAGGTTVTGDLAVPEDPSGLVIFAHGTGSSRRSSRNRAVAASLRQRGLGTLLMDLLTVEEEATELPTSGLRFDIDLLAERLSAATDWARDEPATRQLPIGYFGASTGAAAALRSAAERPHEIAAIVSRGGRPDLAGRALPLVRAPTLLIVGSRDHTVITLNREALDQLQVERELTIVEGATHLFEEPGALEEVARLAGDWFARRVPGRSVG